MIKNYKPRYDLVLLSSMESLADTFGRGCVTHSGQQEPWPPPYTFEDNLDHVIAYLQKVKEGERFDAEGFSHVGNAFAILSLLVDQEKKDTSLNPKNSEGDRKKG